MKLNCQNCMKGFCDDCIDPKTCLCAENNHDKPKISKLEQQASNILNKIPINKLKQSARQGRKIFQVSSKGKNFQLEILDHEIQTLRPITLLDDNTRFILVYLPTKSTQRFDDEKKIVESEFDNKAFFVICNKTEKNVLPVEDSKLKENCKITVQPSGYLLKWNQKDLDMWRDEKTSTNPVKLYNLHLETLKKYMDFEYDYDYVYLTLWNIGTYFYELFDAYPYNDFTGTKRAGKTKGLTFQELVCFNSIMTADITGASTFRSIEALGSTLLLDESESFKSTKNEQAQHVRTLLLEGFLKDKYAIRTEKIDGGFKQSNFNLYAPKSLGHINAFDDVLEDRCIELLMRRTKDKVKRDLWPTKKDPSFQVIRNLCYRLFLDYGHEIKDLQEEAKSLIHVSGRELQQWTPLITLALFFEKHGISGIIDILKQKIIKSSKDRQIQDEEESKDIQILRYCEEVGIGLGENLEKIKGNALGWIPTEPFYQHLIAEDVAPTYGINPEYFWRSKFSQTLKRLGFKREKKRGGISWLITRNAVDDVKERMGVIEPKQQILQTGSQGSQGSLSSHSGTDTTNKSELNAQSELNEPKTPTNPTTNKSELNALSELHNNNESSQGSHSSRKEIK